MGTRLWLWLLQILGFDPRGLFQFFDGKCWRTVDPLQVARDLFTHPRFDWDETPQLLLTGKAPAQLEAFHVIGEAVRAIFRIPPVDQGGLTDRECLDLLTAFRHYLGDVKKNGSLFQTSPEFMAPPSAGSFDTKVDSVCGSIGNAPFNAPPGSPVAPISGD